MTITRPRACIALALFAWIGSGCATPPAAEASGASAAEPSAGTSGTSSATGAKGGTTPRVALPSLLGRTVDDGMPPGCRIEWESIEPEGEGDSAFFCYKFRAEHPDLGVVPLRIAISEGTIVMVSIQESYSNVSNAEGRFNTLKAAFLDRCGRKTGGFRYLVADCDDYVVDIAWNNQYAQARFEMRYAKAFERLKRGDGGRNDTDDR